MRVIVVVPMIVSAGRVVLLFNSLHGALYRVFGTDRAHVVCAAVRALQMAQPAEPRG